MKKIIFKQKDKITLPVVRRKRRLFHFWLIGIDGNVVAY